MNNFNVYLFYIIKQFKFPPAIKAMHFHNLKIKKTKQNIYFLDIVFSQLTRQFYEINVTV